MYRSPNTVRVIIPTILKWAGRAARMGEGSFQNLTGKPTGKRPIEGKSVDGMTILQ